MEEVKDLQSDLEALRELYGFLHLQCGGDVASNVLGERSKLLLKNLLDAATKRVLETHKMIMEAAERGVCGTSCSSESEKGRVLSEFDQPYVSPNMLKVAPDDVIRNFMKESNHQAFSSLKDEDSSNKLRSPEVISQQSRLNFSFDKSEFRKKHCGLMNEQSNMKQQSVVGSVVGSSTCLASGEDLANANQDEKEGKAVNNLSKDVDNVVKHIESHISALRLCSKLADATKCVVSMPTSVSPMVQAKENLVKQSESNHVVEPFSDMDDLPLIGLGSQRFGKKRVPFKHDDFTKTPSMPVKIPYAIPKNNDVRKESRPTIAKLRSSLPSQSAGSKASVRPISMKKSLADHEILPEQIKGGKGIFRNKILLHQQESEESATAGSEESSTTGSEESSTTGSEESSTAGSGTGSNDSEAYSLVSQDSVSSISRRFDHGVYEESSASTTTSSDYRDLVESGRLYPSRTHKLIRPANTEPAEKAEGQRLGRLRRLKNKLGLIFHHHHHHHHHHGHGHDHGDSGDHSQGVHTKSTWTPLHKIFYHKNRYEVDDNKLRKAKVSNMPVKHQVGHFHALVEGLMRHLRHSKKSKRSKGGMGWPGNDRHGLKNRKVKQLHWWQMFQRQGGVKLPNRRRAVKIGFMSKKPQLRVPKLR
ncbi:hypothetical protein REPUB_Repub13aG0120700 [Reevesia pubescens]